MKKLWHYIKRHWRLLISMGITAAIGTVFFNLMWGDPNLAIAMVAFGTLLLALATAISIDSSRAQEKHRRKEALLMGLLSGQ